MTNGEFICAPMVDQSELAWRLLVKRYNTHLSYSPMIHARIFTDSDHPVYAATQLTEFCGSPVDRPLIIQFCANDPDILLNAALRVQDRCDGVDLNLGCPQGIAKKGKYGAFLMDREKWPLLAQMVKTLRNGLKVQVRCKIRVFEDPKVTLEYALMLEDAGCQVLAVHGRTRNQKGQITGLADWDQIRMVKQHLKIPVIANGNILLLDDAERCLIETGADGVMSAEGLLYNPALFSGKHPRVDDLALEYLEIAKSVPTTMSAAKSHIFKMGRHVMTIWTDIREKVSKSRCIDDLIDTCLILKERIDQEIKLYPMQDLPEKVTQKDLPLPFYLCQPYIRPFRDGVK